MLATKEALFWSRASLLNQEQFFFFLICGLADQAPAICVSTTESRLYKHRPHVLRVDKTCMTSGVWTENRSCMLRNPVAPDWKFPNPTRSVFCFCFIPFCPDKTRSSDHNCHIFKEMGGGGGGDTTLRRIHVTFIFVGMTLSPGEMHTDTEFLREVASQEAV